MRRFITMLLALVLVFALSACDLFNGAFAPQATDASTTSTPTEENTSVTTLGEDKTPSEPYLDTPYEYIVDSYRVSFVFDMFGEEVGTIVIIKDAPKGASITLKQFFNQVHLPSFMNGQEGDMEDADFLEMNLKVNGIPADANTLVYNGSVINVLGQMIIDEEDEELDNPEYFISNSYRVNYMMGRIFKEDADTYFFFVNIEESSNASITVRDFLVDVFYPSQGGETPPDEYVDEALKNTKWIVDGKEASENTPVYDNSVISALFEINKCPPHQWVNGMCDICGEVCYHEERDENGRCLTCYLSDDWIFVNILENGDFVFGIGASADSEILLGELLLRYYEGTWKTLLSQYDIFINDMPVSDEFYTITESCAVRLVSRN